MAKLDHLFQEIACRDIFVQKVELQSAGVTLKVTLGITDGF